MKNVVDTNTHTWQSAFVELMPELQQRLRSAFRHLDADAREKSVAEGVIHAMLSFTRLFEQGRTVSASASTLCWYAVLAVKRGRPACGRMNGREPMSRYCRLATGIHVEQSSDNWIDLIVEDKRAPVPDQVAARIDFRAWFNTLSRRMRHIARDLAIGSSTGEVARRYGVTAGRISQLRRELQTSWCEFQREREPALA